MSLARTESRTDRDPSRATPQGERELFEFVYRRMRALAGARATDLDDLVQVAAEQVFRASDAFEGRSEFSTWVYAICYRVLLSHQRWYRRWSLRFTLKPQQNEPVDSEPSSLALLEGRERVLQLRAALATLSDKYRAVVVLHDLEGLAIAEVASIVSANELTVRSRLRDGRKLLRQRLGDSQRFRPSRRQ